RQARDIVFKRPSNLPRDSISEISAISGRNSEERERAQAAELMFEPSFDIGDFYGSMEDAIEEDLATAALETEDKKRKTVEMVLKNLGQVGSQTAGAAYTALAVMGHGAQNLGHLGYKTATRVGQGAALVGHAINDTGESINTALETAGGAVRDLAGNVISTGIDLNQRATDAVMSRLDHEIYMLQQRRDHELMMRQRYPTHGVSSSYVPQGGYIPMIQNPDQQARRRSNHQAIEDAQAEAIAAANVSLHSSESSHHVAPSPGPGRRSKTSTGPQAMHQLMLQSVDEPTGPKPRAKAKAKSKLQARQDEDKAAGTTRSGKKYKAL
ncbi:MAG: hypothetical protein EBU33_11090, partial [Sphingobacteriia bacterium]|nr:hypothetical protein [Sphingobacteriia bacterium]